MNVLPPPEPAPGSHAHAGTDAGAAAFARDSAQLGGSPWLGVAAQASAEVVAANGRALGVVRALLAPQAAAATPAAAVVPPPAPLQTAGLETAGLETAGLETAGLASTAAASPLAGGGATPLHRLQAQPIAGADDAGGSAQGLACLLAHFQLLVAADGPLPFVRFAAPAFDAARQAAAAHAPPGEAPDPDVCLAMLAPAASATMRASLQAFVAQPFVPPDDRLAAVAALATWALETPVPLALYAIFEAQLADP